MYDVLPEKWIDTFDRGTTDGFNRDSTGSRDHDHSYQRSSFIVNE